MNPEIYWRIERMRVRYGSNGPPPNHPDRRDWNRMINADSPLRLWRRILVGVLRFYRKWF